MKVKMHWTVNDFEDSLILAFEDGTSDEDIKKELDGQLSKRGLDADKHNVWTQDLEG